MTANSAMFGLARISSSVTGAAQYLYLKYIIYSKHDEYIKAGGLYHCG